MDTPVKKLSKKEFDIILYGDSKFEGVIPNLQRRWKETESDFTRAEIEKYMLIKKCPTCQGRRLKPEALAVKVANLSIAEMSAMSVEKAINFFRHT